MGIRSRAETSPSMKHVLVRKGAMVVVAAGAGAAVDTAAEVVVAAAEAASAVAGEIAAVAADVIANGNIRNPTEI